MKRYKGERFFEDVIFVIVSIMSLGCFLPLLHVAALSLSSKDAVNAGRVSFFPIEFTLAPYEYILQDGQYLRSFGVSALRTVVGTLIQLCTTIMVAYPMSLSKRYFPARNRYMTYLLFTSMFGGGLIPWYLLITRMGLTNNFAALIVPDMMAISSAILMMNYFRNLPKALFESAQIDGAGHIRILVSLYLPMSLPIIATVMLFSSVGFWNDYFRGMIVMTAGKWIPLQTYIRSLTFDTASAQNNTTLTNPTYMAMVAQISGRNFTSAKLMVAMLPLLVVYPFMQRYFVTGITLGAVKE